MTILFCKIPPILPFPKGGINPPLWQRGARGDFLNKAEKVSRLDSGLISYLLINEKRFKKNKAADRTQETQ